MPYYCVKKGYTPGIYSTWSECKEQVSGYSGPKYKKFDTLVEAQKFLNEDSIDSNQKIETALKKSKNEVFYSVHKGKNPGIYNNWNDCKQQTIGYKGAIYKKFTNREDAQKFLVSGLTQEENKIELEIDPDAIDVYTDGSHIKRNGYEGCGYGIYIPKLNLEQGKVLYGDKTNNRAELSAIIDSINLLDQKGYKSITIYTDSSYSILIFGDTGDKYEKKAFKNVKNKDLVIIAQEIKKKQLRLCFRHVKAHTGDIENSIFFGNDIADKMANKYAVIDYINNDSEWINRIYNIGKYNTTLSNMNIDYLKNYIKSESYINLCKKNEHYRTENHIIECYISSIDRSSIKT